MTCPSCGAVAPAGARFCATCGHLLQAPTEERRVATVLFADLVGFTTMSETLDPEQVKNLVDACFDRLATDITAFGGRIDKIVGDAIVALFGAPVAHEDDAERAVRAALQMQRTTSSLGINIPGAVSSIRVGGVQLRVGINTGEVIVGSVRAGGEYTAMGDVVNVASRLQGLAEPGQVLVGPATHAATREVVRYEPVGPVHARGREEPVDAWLAIEALAPPGYRPRRGRTPLIGRTEELGVLRYATATAVSRRRAQLMLLLGEAGVGKSRLSEEIATHALTQHDALVLEGRCVPYGEANPWWPIAEAIRQASRIDLTDDDDAALDKARQIVAMTLGLAPDAAEVERVADGLLYVMGDEDRLADVDSARAADDGRRALQTVFEAIARKRPLVLVISELHWADGLVHDLIGQLLDKLRNLPFIVIGTARPELSERWMPPAGRTNLLILQLDPLSADAAAELLDVLVPGGITAELRTLLLERAGGNPFFLEELVALMEEQGLLTEDLATSRDLPATLRGLLAARLDALLPSERAMLEDAAVTGRAGQVEALAALAKARGEPDPGAVIESLVSKDLLLLKQQVFKFRSNLVREVAYETLTKAERARRHYRLASWLATRLRELDREDEELEQLAHHFGAAAELWAELGSVDGVPADIATQALQAIERAAQRADLRGHHTVSRDLLDHALRIIPATESAERRNLLLSRAGTLASLRELKAAHLDVAAVLDEADTIGDRTDHARALTVLGEILEKELQYEEAVGTLTDAIDEWKAIGDRTGEAWALRRRGMTNISAGLSERAVPDIEEALGAFRDLGDRKGEAWALQNLAWAEFGLGKLDDAEARLDDAARAFTEIGDMGGLGWVLGLLGWVRFQQGNLDEAELLVDQISGEIGQRGDRWAIAITQLLRSFIRLWKGQTADAIPAAMEARAIFQELGDPTDELRATAPLARALVARGRFDEGATLLEEVYARASRSGYHRARQFAAMVAGITFAHAGDTERTLQAARIVADDLEGTMAEITGPERLVLLGIAALMAGYPDDALVHLEEAMVQAEGGVRANVLATTALAWAANGRSEDAIGAAEEVETIPTRTYMDLTLAELAGAIGRLQTGDIEGADRELGRAQARVDATGDRMMQAVVRLARALFLAAVERPGAAEADADARRRLSEMGVTGEGWETIFRLGLRHGART